jgi:YD repeat-containing protein
MTTEIDDVDTTMTSEFTGLPTGWSTPSSGGLNLTTTDSVDGLGRVTKSTTPAGNVTYQLYDDVDHEVRIYAGWNATSHTPTGPTTVVRDDRADGYVETLTMSATPHLDGSNLPDGQESIGSLQTLSRTNYDDAQQAVGTDAYFNLSGLTYTTSTSLGTVGTNFYTTTQGYDDRGRPNKTVSPTLTITRTVYDGLGRVVSTFVGTDDSPTTGYWSPTNLTGTNMVMVSSEQYDGGGVGDGNLTEETEYPNDGTPNRVTDSFYDWRDRLVATKGGVQSTESTSVHRPITYLQYDNLNEVVSQQQFDGDGVSITSTSGVPNAPSSSLLRAKTTTSYDDQGRVYQSNLWSVDPSSGSVSTYALHTDTWYDSRGNVIKLAVPNGPFTKTLYDGVGRSAAVYTTDGGGDAAPGATGSWTDAGNVTGDNVLDQTETTYDADSNVILTADRQRFDDSATTGVLGDPSSTSP